MSLQPKPLAGVWWDALQRLVKISQILTTPSESPVIVMPSFACSVMDWIGAEVVDVNFESVTVGSVNGASICQTLTDLSKDVVMREEGEENTKKAIYWVWPTNVPTR